MKLYEGGHLNIDSPVNPYLDAAEVFKNPKDATRITIRQLLNHTSGLGVYQHVGNAKIVGKMENIPMRMSIMTYLVL